MIVCPKCSTQMSNYRGLGGHAKVCTLTPQDLFWLKVRRGDGCWLWQGRLDALGYGRFGRTGELVYAHRCAWTFTNGPVPVGMDVCHTCDVRRCCNPTHLFLGTAADNMADMQRKGRSGSIGEKNLHAKLTEDKVRLIKSLYRQTSPRKGNGMELARQFGVSDGAIYAIAKGRSWKHLK